MEKIHGKSLNSGIAAGKIVVFKNSNSVLENYSNDEPLIIIADELTPKDTVKFINKNIVGIAVKKGTTNSHIAILTRTMNIPALTDIDVQSKWYGKMCILDSYSGFIIIEPNKEQLNSFEKEKNKKVQQQIKLKHSYSGKPAITNLGIKIDLLANISTPSDIDSVIENDADGIGNFKTEFMLLNKEYCMDEEEQFNIYKKIACLMGDKKTVIRTFDFGADKLPFFIPNENEENPAMGYRAIRVCLDHPEIFIPQVRAILRASAYGNVAIMYPMIISTEEVKKIKKIVEDIMQELREKNIPFNEHIEQGIMIETPAAVIISSDLAKIVDFFSIGTNDLTQYTLAIDRNNSKLSNINDIYHPAILKSIEYTIKSAHESNIWVSVSGELGADLSMTKLFLDYGLDALTVSPNNILKLKEKIRGM